ncbi:c-type cytochrome domain-containing protein [Rurimicrobium arvi]|uniref:Cytochrome C Planctomycete-type domain-containing protein n=1 Tax=Rurimicrobium arvi TaxID=2049916 RepID=A0ABP8MIQ3_9BACT
MKPLIILLLGSIALCSCTHPPASYKGEYPDDVRVIVEQKCATAGCHNDKSYENAAGLRLDRWEHMFAGGNSGSVVIPYNTANSSLMYFINTDSSEGPVLQPTMPVNGTPLTAAEYQTIKKWIAAGAPDRTGAVPFASDAATRQKVYITQQGCDLIAVVDAQTNLIMRYISIGVSNAIETPHCVRFTPDGKYAYVSFTSGGYLQKIDATTDQVVDQMYLGDGSWNLFHIAPSGKELLITDYEGGKIELIDLEKMSIEMTYEDFQNPHGIECNAAFDTFYVTAQFGNTVYRLTRSGRVKELSIDGNDPNHKADTYNPHEIMMTPDRSRYFLTCQTSNEVRVMDTKTGALLKVIPVGTFPQEIALSHSKPYMIISCQEDITPEYPGYKGSVYVIDYNTMEVVKRIPGPFYQIHGVSVDDKSGKIFIASRNVSSTGPAPHHTSQCGGRNGYYSVYDLNTFQPVTTKRYEAAVDPYSSDIRFKD